MKEPNDYSHCADFTASEKRAGCASSRRTELPEGPDSPSVVDLGPLLLLQSRNADGDCLIEENAHKLRLCRQ